MKLKVGDRKRFDQWRSSAVHHDLSQLINRINKLDHFYLESDINILNIEELIIRYPSLEIVEIDTSPQIKIKDLISRLTGEENLTYITEHEEISWGYELRPGSSNPTELREFKEIKRMIHTRCLYCLSATKDALDPDKTIVEYDILDDDLLLLAEQIEEEKEHIRVYSLIFPRNITDFCDMVRTYEDIETPTARISIPGQQGKMIEISKFDTFISRPIKCVLLYTDEDADLAQYIRYNFAALNEMTNHYLNIYTIEQPTKVRGISANEYWKATLEQTKYSFLQMMGWTRYKPYNKADAYKIASWLGVYPDALPCIVILGDINSDEKIVVFITGEFQQFFRGLSSVVLRTLDKIGASKINLLENFDEFKMVFMESWSAWKKEVGERKEQVTTFTFNGQTVFINRPSGHLEIKDFQHD